MKQKIGLGLMALALSACGASTESDASKATLSMSFVSSTVSALKAMKVWNQLEMTPMASTITPLTVGAADGLISYKVYFRSITICDSVTQSGSGYQNSSGCADLYTNDSDAYTGTEAPTANDITRFTAAGEGKFYDLLSETDLDQLSQDVSVAAGNYNYGLMEVHPWVKIKAKSGTVCTSDNDQGLTQNGSGTTDYSVTVSTLNCSDLTGGAPEEALVYMGNGNSNFKFVKTFTATAGQSVALDLAFNLDKAVLVNDGSADGDAVGQLKELSGATLKDDGFFVPMFQAGPAPRASTDTNKVETYLFDVPGEFVFRVELVYNGSDTTKAPLATMGTLIANGNTGVGGNAAVKLNDVEADGDVVTFKTWDDIEFMTFTRTATGTAATGTLKCANGATGTGFAFCSATADKTITDSDGPTVSDLN